MQILKTDEYDRWFTKLKELTAKAKINARLRRIGLVGCLIGDFKSVGEKVIELRFNIGSGYRIYLTEAKGDFILLLIGGNKSSQQRDIAKAKKLCSEWRKTYEHKS